MINRENYLQIVLESFLLDHTSGHRDPVQIRPAKGQTYSQNMLVECSRRMINMDLYPLTTNFLAWVRVKRTLDYSPHLYCYHGDAIVTMTTIQAKEFILKYPNGRREGD